MTTLASLQASQPRVAGVLSAALASGRMHHAYLLVGAELATAELAGKAVARALVCERPREGAAKADGCGECAGCRKLASGNHPDVIGVAPNDKGVIAIESVRDAAARLSLRAAESRTKVVLIPRADGMTPAAQNALLKTLEEPPGPTCFLLTAARWRALLPTIRSRCLTLRLAPVDRLGAHARLAEAGVAAELARSLAPIVGADAVAASELVEQGAAELRDRLQQLLQGPLGARELLAAAADFGSARERSDLALALIEVAVRDALARRHGAQADLLYDPDVPLLAGTSGRALETIVARLQQLRRLTSLHVNRTLALESVLAPVMGAGT